MGRKILSGGQQARLLLGMLLAGVVLSTGPAPSAQAASFGYATGFGGTDKDEGKAVAVDASGNSYSTGYTGMFSGTADFDPSTGVHYLTSDGADDAYIAKLDDSGALVWVYALGGSSYLNTSSLAVDADANVYILGRFSGTVDLDPGSGVLNLDAGGSTSGFVAKLSSTGSLLWARAFAGPGGVLMAALALDGAGNAYLTGAYAGMVDFDPGPGTLTLTSTPAATPGDVEPDIFLVKLDTNGSLVWAQVFGGSGVDVAQGIAVDQQGALHLTGFFEGSVDFESGPGVQQWTSSGQWDTFIVKLTQSEAPVQTVPGPQTTPEDAALVFSAAAGNRISVADPDAGSSPLRVTLTATSGTMTLDGTAGLTFSQGDGSADATMTFTGTLAAVNAALDGSTFTPATNFSGTAGLQMVTHDLVGPSGGQSDTDSLAIAVTVVNDAPVAQNDAYTAVAQTTLTVEAPGLLSNDTDVDTAAGSLTAAVLAGPAHGAVALQPNGRFTYTPATGYAGSDSFTYRASDGNSWSAPTTVTITVTPVQCMPRPQVRVGPSTGTGRLAVHIEPTPLNTQQPNPIQQLRFGTFQNATVTLNGQSIASGQTVTLPPNSLAVDFTVDRQNSAQSTTVPFTAVDGCGSWQTFVGGGAGAGF